MIKSSNKPAAPNAPPFAINHDAPGVGDSGRKKTRWNRLGRWAPLLLLASGIGAVTFMMASRFAPGAPFPELSVVEAEKQFEDADAKYMSATRLTDSASALVRDVGLNNTPASRAVDKINRSLVEPLALKRAQAGIELTLTKRRVDADHHLNSYDDLLTALLDRIRLELSGIEYPVLNIVEPSANQSPTQYQLFVPGAVADRSREVLDSTQIVKFGTYSTRLAAIDAMETLKQRDIPACYLPVHLSGGGSESVVYIRSENEASARRTLVNIRPSSP